MPDIYEQILTHPESWLLVARPDGAGGWTDPAAPIRLVERDAAAAGQKLFEQVDATIFSRPTIAALLPLFDNFNPFEGEAESGLGDATHSIEVEAFLDAIMPTAPMQLAADYLRAEAPAEFPNDGAVRVWARQVWFELFLNEFAAPERDCSGFEHVFAGEITSEAQPGDEQDDVGGYHSWIKYAHDQQAGLVTYRRHDYPATAAIAGKNNPNEASVVMTWQVNGDVYLKKAGGFFVGDLPELQIALGIVGVFDALRCAFAAGAGNATDRRMKLGADTIDLTVYHQTIRSGNAKKPGPHLRSMFPRFRGPAPQGGGGGGVPNTPHNNGPIRIHRALPNPQGTDETGEWVELRNATQHALTLDGWTLRDAQGRTHPLAGGIAAGAIVRIALTREQPNAMQLGNNGGWILLFEAAERIAAVRYGAAQNEQIIEFS